MSRILLALCLLVLTACGGGRVSGPDERRDTDPPQCVASSPACR